MTAADLSGAPDRRVLRGDRAAAVGPAEDTALPAVAS